jgi:hypothetical protein
MRGKQMNPNFFK